MDINLNDLLKSLGIKDSFDTRAKEALEKEKGNVDDTSIFDSQQSFVSHYSEQIFGDKDEVDFQDFGDNLVKSGYVENDEIVGLQALVDNNADNKLSKDEAENLLSTVYANAAPEPEAAKTQTTEAQTQESDTAEELYDAVEVQPWGTGEDDCLSRIIQKHVDGIQLYTDDYHQYVAETCRLNGIEDPNLFSNKEVKLPVMKKDDNGEIIKDENGKIQFYSEEELRQMQEGNAQSTGTAAEPDSSRETRINVNGQVTGYTDSLLNENGQVEKEIFYDTDMNFINYTTYEYDGNGNVTCERNYNSESELTGAKTYSYNSEGKLISEENRNSNNEVETTKEYAYDEQGRVSNIVTQNKDGLVVQQEKKFYYDNGAIDTTIYDENGKTKEIIYEEYNTIDHKFYDEDENLTEHYADTFDEDGKQTGTIYYDENGLQEKRVRTEYNEEGIRIRVYEYDSQDALVKTTECDPQTGEIISDEES